MIAIVFGLLELGAFVSLAEAARRGSRLARAGALIQAALHGTAAAFAVFEALVYLSLRCDDHWIAGPARRAQDLHWWDSANAWQWWAEFGVAVLAATAIFTALAATKRARCRIAVARMGLGAALLGAWGALLLPG